MRKVSSKRTRIAFPIIRLGNILPFSSISATRRPDQVQQQAEQRRFSGAVITHYTEAYPSLYFKFGNIRDDVFPVPLPEVERFIMFYFCLKLLC